LQTEFGGSLLEELHLLLAVSLLVVLQALIDVLLPTISRASSAKFETAVDASTMGRESLSHRPRFSLPKPVG
jgi:hypothetical protein